ncbi:MAG: DUF2182 domain-containing protein [Acidobacteriota bacterium]|nr:DUF2182 domain-containing protein [Acidobacteriota bacterium]
MTWMRMSGQSWLGAAASFVVMWVVMMVAMMLPPLVATLSRYRDALHQSGVPHVDRLTAIASAAYFVVWTAIGVAIFPLGVALAAFEMKEPALSRLVPAAAALIVTLAGLLQFTTWKARRLACCRAVPRRVLQTNAWRYGIHVAYHCVACCANLMTIVLILGVMDLRAMAAGTPAIAFERLAPNGDGAARAIGAVAIGTGLFLLARATRLV